MTDLRKEIAYVNLKAAIDDYNTAVSIYKAHNTEANECKVKEKQAYLVGYISAYEMVTGEVISLEHDGIKLKYSLITKLNIL